jgi:hypothetical protein
MDLETQRKESIFEGKVNGPYYILGGWNSQHDVLAFIEWEKDQDNDIFRLMISKSDGSSSVKIDETQIQSFAHHEEIPFYGWKFVSEN